MNDAERDALEQDLDSLDGECAYRAMVAVDKLRAELAGALMGAERAETEAGDLRLRIRHFESDLSSCLDEQRAHAETRERAEAAEERERHAVAEVYEVNSRLRAEKAALRNELTAARAKLEAAERTLAAFQGWETRIKTPAEQAVLEAARAWRLSWDDHESAPNEEELSEEFALFCAVGSLMAEPMVSDFEADLARREAAKQTQADAAESVGFGHLADAMRREAAK